jgi:signal transduction histidine kinase/CheY-like chemotaxis protein
MVDRKQRPGSSPQPAASASIRIGANTSSSAGRRADSSDSRVSPSESAARTITTGERPTVEASELTGVDSSALIRSNAMLFLVAAVCTSVFALTELVTGHFRELGATYLWLVAAAVLGWLAFALRERGWQMIWTALIGFTSVNTLVSAANMQSSVLLAGLLVILMWSGMILRPRYNALLAGYAVIAMLATGGEIVLDPGEMNSAAGENAFPIPVLITFIAIPLGLGATLHLRQRTAENSLRASIAKLEEQREELKRRLEGKSNELELSREQLFEAQKLKTVGTMASGLAHELNNILTPIRGHAELIAEGVPNPEQTRRYGQRILDSAAAAAHITTTLLTYTRQGTFQPVRSNLRQLLQGKILPFLSKSLPGNVRLKVELARNVSVDVDRVQLEQAIHNLLLNASDAMPDGGEITIGLSTSSLPASKLEGDEPEEDPEAEQVSAVIEIGDTGTGIDKEHLDQIFDPFFTTKPPGSGSGLGLAMVMGTVTRHQGRITVESKIGYGTTFKIWLPLAGSDEKSDAHKPWPVLRGDRAKGPVVVVITEDQDALDEFEELLEATECAPICTSDAKGATPLLTEMGDKVDLLILDLELEASDGKRLFKSVRELFPEMPVILLSDQPTDPAVQRLIAAGPTRSVRKPMDNRLFSALLTDLLNPADGYVRDFTPVPITPGADISGPHPRAG